MARLFRGRHSKLRLVPSTLSKEDFQRVYDLMDTSMDSDCGILCGSLCCTEYELDRYVSSTGRRRNV